MLKTVKVLKETLLYRKANYSPVFFKFLLMTPSQQCTLQRLYPGTNNTQLRNNTSPLNCDAPPPVAFLNNPVLTYQNDFIIHRCTTT